MCVSPDSRLREALRIEDLKGLSLSFPLSLCIYGFQINKSKNQQQKQKTRHNNGRSSMDFLRDEKMLKHESVDLKDKQEQKDKEEKEKTFQTEKTLETLHLE